MFRRMSLFVLILTVTIPVACRSPESFSTDPLSFDPAQAASRPTCPGIPAGTSAISLLPSAQWTIGVGAILDYGAVNQNGAVIPDCALVWSTSNSRVATVNASGVATGKSIGGPITVQVQTASKPTLKAGVLLAVGSAVAIVAVSPTTATLTPAQALQVTAVVRDANGTTLTNRIVTWSSAAPSIASVTAAGLVTGVGPGTTTITAISEGRSGSMTVTVNPLGYRSVAAGQYHACGIRVDYSVACWGDNTYARLGTGDRVSSLVPRPVAGSLRFKQLTVGWVHTCGITDTGDAYCWGQGHQLGIGLVDPSGQATVPTKVSGDLKWAELSAGDIHTCGITVDGAAYCWGYGLADGQLGTGVLETRNAPALVSGGRSYTSISAGAYHTCAVASDQVAYCWGRNDFGGLGIGTGGDRYAPTAVSTSLRFRSVSGGGDNSCGITTDGKGFCWGSDQFGRLGNGDAVGDSYVPSAMAFAGTVTDIRLSPTHGCLIDDGGKVYCWGNNQAGQLGDGSTNGRSTPGLVPGVTNVTTLSANGRPDYNQTEYVSCATGSDFKAFCWGSNTYGQIGDGTTIRRFTPTPVLYP
jgi:alpha-tubulin suppressor-like RCC1 family protein